MLINIGSDPKQNSQEASEQLFEKKLNYEITKCAFY